MALFLKTSKLVIRGVGLNKHAKLPNFQNVQSLLNQNLASVNVLVNKRDCATEAPKIMTFNSLYKALHQLQTDINRKSRIFKKDVDQILNSVEHWRSISQQHSLALLGSCGSLSFFETHHERLMLCAKIWKMYEKIGVKFDISHYNVLLQVYLENEHTFCPKKFLIELEKKKIIPNLVTYQRLLRAYCVKGDIRGASDLLEIMKEKDLPLNEYIFNSLILCYSQIGDIESACGIISLMKAKEVEPTSATYRDFISGLAKIGQVDKIQEILEECKKNEIEMLDKDLLEVVYILAANSMVKEACELLKRVKKEVGYNKYASMLVNKLLEKNLDQVALEMFLTLESKNEDHEKQNLSKFVIDYYFKFRPVQQLVNVCEHLHDRGFSMVPHNFALKRFIAEESWDRCLQFFTQLKRVNRPVRTHYFWPLIIRAKEEGNTGILKILEAMKEFKAVKCYQTTTNIIVPNYVFQNDFLKDIETLEKAGVAENHICSRLLIEFIQRDELHKAALLARSKSIGTMTPLMLKRLAECLLRTRKMDSIVNILFYVAHDRQLNSSMLLEPEESSENEREPKIDSSAHLVMVEYFFNHLITKCFIGLDDLQALLEAMITQRLPINLKTASLIQSKFSDEKTVNLIKKLTEIDFEPLSMVQSAKKKVSVKFSQIRKLGLRGNPAAEELWEEEGRKTNTDDLIGLICLNTKLQNIDKAMEYCRMLPDNDSSYIMKHNVVQFRDFLNLLYSNGRKEELEEATTIGIKTGTLPPGDYYYLIRYHLDNNNTEEAVEVFCKNCVPNRNFLMYPQIVDHLLDKNDSSQLLGKITTAVAEVLGKDKSTTLFFFRCLRKGLHRQAKKLMDQFSNKTKNLFHSDISFGLENLYRENSTIGLKTFLKVSQNDLVVYRQEAFKYLLRLYMKDNDITNIEKLLIDMQEENYYLDDETLIRDLHQFFLRKGKESPFGSDYIQAKESNAHKQTPKSPNDSCLITELVQKKELGEAAKRLANEPVLGDVNLVLSEFARAGMVDVVMTLCKRYPDYVKSKVSFAFLDSGKWKEYVEFLNFLDETNNPQIEQSFTLFNMDLPQLDGEVIKAYKNIALKAFVKGNNWRAMLSYWLLCLTKDHLRQEAEEIYDNFISHCPRKLNHYFEKVVEANADLLEKIINHPKYSADSKLMSNIFSSLLKQKCRQTDLDEAVRLLNDAVERGLGPFLDTSILKTLKNKLHKSDRSFPHEELLDVEKEKVVDRA